MIYGYDVSQYQPGFDHHRARREGFDFCGLRAVGSENNPDTSFHRHYDQARAAGMIVLGGYIFLNNKFSAAQQADTWMRHAPRDCPLIVDVEPTPYSGNRAKAQEVVDRVRQAGRPVSLIYIGLPLWQQWGRPDIRSLGTGLWHPHYPDNNGGYASEILQRVPGHYWNGFGGFGGVDVLQYSQAATIAGNRPTDADAFRGTREQLIALVGGEETELRDDEIHALFDCLEELTGSRVVGEYPGWPAHNGNRHTALDFDRWADWHINQALRRMIGHGPKLQALIDSLGSESFDLAELRAQVRAHAKASVEQAVVDVNLDVNQPDEE